MLYLVFPLILLSTTIMAMEEIPLDDNPEARSVRNQALSESQKEKVTIKKLQLPNDDEATANSMVDSARAPFSSRHKPIEIPQIPGPCLADRKEHEILLYRILIPCSCPSLSWHCRDCCHESKMILATRCFYCNQGEPPPTEKIKLPTVEESMLVDAVTRGKEQEVIDYVEESKVNVNCRVFKRGPTQEYYEKTPLLQAAKHARETIAIYLLGRDAKLNHRTNDGFTPLLALLAGLSDDPAKMQENERRERMFLMFINRPQDPADLELHSKCMPTALILALQTKFGRERIVPALIDKIVYVNHQHPLELCPPEDPLYEQVSRLLILKGAMRRDAPTPRIVTLPPLSATSTPRGDSETPRSGPVSARGEIGVTRARSNSASLLASVFGVGSPRAASPHSSPPASPQPVREREMDPPQSPSKATTPWYKRLLGSSNVLERNRSEEQPGEASSLTCTNYADWYKETQKSGQLNDDDNGKKTVTDKIMGAEETK